MAFWDNPAVAGALGVAVGSATAFVQGALSARAKAGEELRERRLEAYPVIWRETAALSRYPVAELIWEDLKELHLALRSWYYTVGGLFLSERSRARYGDVQELLGAYLVRARDRTAPVDPGAYEALVETCSAFRTAMTEDLSTRRLRSLIWLLASWRWHGVKAREARARIDAAGGGRMALPLAELGLPEAGAGAGAKPPGRLP